MLFLLPEINKREEESWVCSTEVWHIGTLHKFSLTC